MRPPELSLLGMFGSVTVVEEPVQGGGAYRGTRQRPVPVRRVTGTLTVHAPVAASHGLGTVRQPATGTLTGIGAVGMARGHGQVISIPDRPVPRVRRRQPAPLPVARGTLTTTAPSPRIEVHATVRLPVPSIPVTEADDLLVSALVFGMWRDA